MKVDRPFLWSSAWSRNFVGGEKETPFAMLVMLQKAISSQSHHGNAALIETLPLQVRSRDTGRRLPLTIHCFPVLCGTATFPLCVFSSPHPTD